MREYKKIIRLILNYIWKFAEEHSSLSIILIYNISIILISLIFYYIIPIILNYAPGMVEQNYAEKWFGMSYLLQFIIIIALALLFGTIFLVNILKGIDEWKNIKNIDFQNIRRIRTKCLNLPYVIYIVQIVFPVTFVIILMLLLSWNKTPIFAILKLIIMVFSFFAMAAVITFIFAKKVFTAILLKTPSNNGLEGIRIGLRDKVFLQILPVFIVAILFTSLVGYSRLIDEKGNLIFTIYKEKLIETFSQPGKTLSLFQIKQKLNEIHVNEIRGCSFIITPQGRIITSDGSKFSKIFINYIYDLSPSHDGRISDLTGETQGTMVKIQMNSETWIVGFKYEVASNQAAVFILISFIILFVFCIFVISYFSNTITEDISLVVNNLTDIVKGAVVDLETKIPVTSNDEIGDLVVAFNKIQEREKQHIKDIEENQRVLLERERLATLGQMIGGIAHNIRSPIMSIAGGMEALKDLVKEYDESVDNVSVTKEDHHEIAKEMMEWLESMRPYCSFMSDLISAVREQAVQLNASTYTNFTLEELVKRIELLLKFELKRNNCTIETDVQADLDTTINGEVNNLVQVCNNLIINAIQAYDGQGGRIEFKVSRQGTKIVFTIKDYGKGMPPEVKTRLLKEMITTKGKRGTGLGLFMSNLTIKGRFGGDLWFESEEGKGSTFYFSIPCS